MRFFQQNKIPINQFLNYAFVLSTTWVPSNGGGGIL